MPTLSCKPWEGRHRKRDGRPMLGDRYAYRVLWEAEHGPVPAGKVLHHTCEHPWCVEVTHLEPQTRGQHLREHHKTGDWGQALKTHCPAGHDYDVHGWTYHRPNGTTERQCRECSRLYKRRKRAEARAEKDALPS